MRRTRRDGREPAENRSQLAARDDLSRVGQIDDRGDVSVRVPTHGEVVVGHRRVGQHNSVVDGQRRERGDTERRDREAHRRPAIGELLALENTVDDHNLVDGGVGRVGDDDAHPDVADQIGDAGIQVRFHFGEDCLGILMAHAIDEPGRMSWNCWVRTCLHR